MLKPSLSDNLSGKPIFGLLVWQLKTGLQKNSKHKTEQKHKRSNYKSICSTKNYFLTFSLIETVLLSTTAYVLL